MRRWMPPMWLSVMVLCIVMVWRMLGAPMAAQEWRALQTPLWQARTLLPSRVVRVLKWWFTPQTAQTEDAALLNDSLSADELALRRMQQGEDVVLSVYLAAQDRVVEMELETYVCGVVAAEMPATYHLEALMAQAVAARTRALWQMQSGGCALHAGADICTDSAHCQGYATAQQCRDMWGNEYAAYAARVVGAVGSTRGEMLTYEGRPITVMYHAISGGRTEDVQAVFSSSLPYLVSVESSEETGVRGLYTDISFTFEEMADRLGDGVTADEVRRTFSIGGYTDSGRVASVHVDGRVIPATQLRGLLGLRSTWFSLSTTDGGITFHQRGYGHGVGMSQAGANGMAAAGDGYRTILLHFYPGVEVQKVS